MHRVVLGYKTVIAYHDQGAGIPILLIHGFTGTARSHLGWLIDDLAADYRIIAPDLRGYGNSQPPRRDFPVDFYQRDADDLAELLEHLAPGPVALLGFSDGAESALLLAARRPDLVRCVLAWGVAGVIAPAMLASIQNWLPVADWGSDREAWRRQIVADHGEAQFVPLIEGWVAAAEAIAASGGNICLEQATAIRCPTLLINGDGDVGNPPDDLHRLAARIDDCRIEFVAGSGHAVHEDQPERFRKLVREFLIAR
jgi:valacyclovir hydrolase